MEGRGTSSYGGPGNRTTTYGYTTETTQFDDALIQHGVITKEQAIMAKGATEEQARALLQQEQDRKARDEQAREAYSWQTDPTVKKENSDEDDDDSFLDDDDDDEFLQQYRQERMQQMKEQHDSKIPTFGQVIPITRPEWQHHVTDASQHSWVLVYLTSPGDAERTGRVEQSLHELAALLPHVKCVTTPVHHALQNQHWPRHHLPTLFCYRHGTLQQQCIGMDPRATAEDVYQLLQEKNVIVTAA